MKTDVKSDAATKPSYLLILHSYHHNNTEKIANTMAKELDAQICRPGQIDMEDLEAFDTIGFGAGIDSGRHYQSLIGFADSLPQVEGKNAFIFSTSSGIGPFENNHKALRDILRKKGYVIMGEFACPGHNTNSFLKLFGGINKGRPNEGDLERAREFARNAIKGATG